MSTPKTDLPPILTQADAIKSLIGSFLEPNELGNLSGTCQSFHFSYRERMAEKKKASQLLTHVFNADPKSVKEMLSESKSESEGSFFLVRAVKRIRRAYLDYQEFMAKQVLPKPPKPKRSACIVLDKSSCREEYFSRSREKMMLQRSWKNISPLEAVAWCGDNFLLKELLKHVPESQRLEAAQQLQGILDRKETTENGEYLAPFNALLKAYVVFNTEKDDLKQRAQWGTLNELWDKVFQLQKKLPTYGLQEFGQGDMGLDFSKEPMRSPLKYHEMLHGTPLDLENIAYGFALVKSTGFQRFAGSTVWRVLNGITSRNEQNQLVTLSTPVSVFDECFFKLICDVRRKELISHIEVLSNARCV